MTKAADPVAGPRPFEGSRPACLDRIPGWERTRLAVASGDSADSVGVRLSGVVLRVLGEAGARLDRRRDMAEPRHANTRGSARGRHLTDICCAGGGQGTKGRASTQRRSRNPGARSRDRNEGLVAIHSAHPLPSRCRQLTEEHREKPKDPARAGQLLFLGDFCSRTARPRPPDREAPPAGPRGGARRTARLPSRRTAKARPLDQRGPDREGRPAELRSRRPPGPWCGPGPPARRTPPAHPRR